MSGWCFNVGTCFIFRYATFISVNVLNALVKVKKMQSLKIFPWLCKCKLVQFNVLFLRSTLLNISNTRMSLM